MNMHNDEYMKVPPTVPSFAGRFARAIFAGILAFLGVVAGTITIYTFVDKERSLPLVTLGVLDNQCLTKVASVSNLCCNFSFNNREVNNLWVSKMRFANECKRNIIGLPGHDLMYSNLVLAVSDDYKIINAEIEMSDFQAEVYNGDTELFLSFEKWRPNQVCIIKAYCEGASGTGAGLPPRFYSNADPFTQGEMRIFDYQEVGQPVSLLRHLPYWLTSTLLWLGRIGYGLAFAICVMWFIGNWIVMVNRMHWNKKYYISVIARIREIRSPTEGGGDIDMMQKAFWDENHIPKPPSRSPFLKGNKINWGEIIGTNIVIVLLLFFFALPLAALIYV